MLFAGSFQPPDLSPLLKPRSIAVVGASEKPGPGLQVLENLEQLGFDGEVFPVNPGYRELRGMKCFPSLSELGRAGQRVDMVAILLSRDRVLPVLEEAEAVGARAAWAFANGFGEAGEEGRRLQQQLVDFCRRQGILFCGPNCVGVMNPGAHVGTYSAPAPMHIESGNIGMIAQSGYLCIQVANSGRGLGFSMICSAGNEAVVDASDYIGYMLEDPGTKVIMAFIEQFRRPELLPALAARSRELGKPIVFIKVGRSEMARRATTAHTGALAGSDDVQDALFRKLGLIRVNDLDELFETTELFSRLLPLLPGGNGVFAATLSGGLISLTADVGEELNLRFPVWSQEGRKAVAGLLPPYAGIDNPLDAWGFGRVEETYSGCLQAAAAEPEADLLLVSQDVPPDMAPRQVEQYAVVARAAVAAYRRNRKPVVFLSNPSVGFHPHIAGILAEGGVPLLQGTAEGLKAVEHYIDYAEFSRHVFPDLMPAEKSDASLRVAPYFQGAGGALTEYESKRVLAAYGIPCTRETLCRSAEEAWAAAKELAGPVALKVMSRRIQHKTEAGIIALNVTGERAVRDAYEEMVRKAHDYDPAAKIDGVLCQEMVAGAVAEAIVGLIMDPNFGPAVVFGLGGVMVEVLQDRSLDVPPLDRSSARGMIVRTRGYRLLTGFRGRPAGDIEALVDVLVKVGNLAVDRSEEIEALDINPLLIMPEGEGVIAVDALLETGK
jgi:acyl-CoA synthetase (NDP forming)